ncbi:MAG: DUF2461 domain-containing protein, partial [Cytophagaceae bacterium]|nr:DUF2461 domain-containing protein [Cytophagaceae bacterium]
LKRNNNKAWFDNSKPEYLAIKEDFENMLTELIKGTGKFDAGIQTLEPKNCTFRIYKDVRFSKDKTPYKTHMGAYLAKGGKKSIYAGYYLHLEPGNNSILAGGIWMPEPPVLNKVRQEIDYNTKEFLSIINNKTFKKYFKEIEGDKLTRNPKEYPADHPHIELLKFKSYNMIHELKDKDVLSKNFLKNTVKIFKAMKPLNEFINRAIADE